MELRLTVEAVTPIFIAGADQRNIQNEGLRAPTLRGLMRWWFRSIMGTMVSIENLRTLENSVFGSTEQKSAIKVKTITDSQPTSINIPNELRYLWFSMHLQKKRNQRLLWYPQGSEFEIVLHSDNKSALKIASGCLWALIYLGGVGSRMRRGAGSLKGINSRGNIFYSFLFKCNALNDSKQFIEENLEKIFEDFKEYANEKYFPQLSPNFSVLSRKHAKISLINRIFNTFEEALLEISDKYRSFRRKKQQKYRYTFGLPIITYREFRDLRHSSPLFIGVVDLNGKFTVRLVKFYTSIHHRYSSELKFLRRDLDGLDAEINELTVEIPELI